MTSEIEDIQDAACELTHQMQAAFAGKPTASVYLAISYILGEMEMAAKVADRDGTFRVLSGGMDSFIEFNRQH